MKYAPLFQACVINFVNEINKYHNKDITDYIAQNFLTISATYDPLSNEEIKLKYPAEIAEKFIQQSNSVDVLTDEYNSDNFAIPIKQLMYVTKKKDEADFIVAVEKNSDNKVNIIKELKDPSDTHKYSRDDLIEVVSERLKKINIKLGYEKGFNSYVFNQFANFYQIKNDIKYSYKHQIGKSERYTYSQQLIDFIINEIKKDPLNIVESLK